MDSAAVLATLLCFASFTNATGRLTIVRTDSDSPNCIKRVVCSEGELTHPNGYPQTVEYSARRANIEQQLLGRELEKLIKNEEVGDIVYSLLDSNYSYTLAESGQYSGVYRASQVYGIKQTGLLNITLTKTNA